MSEEHNTSTGESVMPTPETPVTGTPAAPGSVTPQKPSLTLEEALQRIADLEHSQKNAKEAEDRLGKKLTAYEKEKAAAEAEKKAAEDAKLDELTRTQKQHAELQAQHAAYMQQMQERLIRYEVKEHARKAGIRDEAIDDVPKLLNSAEFEYDEDGVPKNVDKLIEKLVKAKTYLTPKQEPQQQQQSPSQTAQPGQQRAPVIPPFSGRSSIPTPGTSTTPGRPVRLSDPGVFKEPGTASPYQP